MDVQLYATNKKVYIQKTLSYLDLKYPAAQNIQNGY